MNDNKLIAEFMGVHDEISLDSIAGNIHSWSDAPFFFITEDSKEKVMEGIAKYSKYDTSWDWLMPVVEKIESLGHELIIAESRCKINHNTDHSIEEVINIDIIGSKREATYRAVVEFIKEVNELTK